MTNLRVNIWLFVFLSADSIGQSSGCHAQLRSSMRCFALFPHHLLCRCKGVCFRSCFTRKYAMNVLFESYLRFKTSFLLFGSCEDQTCKTCRCRFCAGRGETNWEGNTNLCLNPGVHTATYTEVRDTFQTNINQNDTIQGTILSERKWSKFLLQLTRKVILTFSIVWGFRFCFFLVFFKSYSQHNVLYQHVNTHRGENWEISQRKSFVCVDNRWVLLCARCVLKDLPSTSMLQC